MAISIDFNLGRGFSRLTKLITLFNNTGERAFALVRLAANVADTETLTIGVDVLEFDSMGSAGTAMGAQTLPNNAVDVRYTFDADYILAVGQLVMIESEILRVKEIAGDNRTVVFQRARCGTSAAAHAATTATFKSVVTAGRIPIGLTALTPTVTSAALVAEINAGCGTDAAIGKIRAVAPDVNTVLLVAREKGALALAVTETMAGAGNAVDASPMAGGTAQPARHRINTGKRAAIAAEVTAGKFFIPCDFDPLVAIIQVRTAAGVPVAWVGATTLVAKTGEKPAYVLVDNTGATDFAATDVISWIITG